LPWQTAASVSQDRLCDAVGGKVPCRIAEQLREPVAGPIEPALDYADGPKDLMSSGLHFGPIKHRSLKPTFNPDACSKHVVERACRPRT
jgi:hypothetical protein